MARLVKDMQGKDDNRKHLGLLVVGELGRQTDLSKVKNLQVSQFAADAGAHGVLLSAWVWVKEFVCCRNRPV